MFDDRNGSYAETVAIPRNEYSDLIRRSVLLDIIIQQSHTAPSYELGSIVEAVRATLYPVERADDNA